MTEPRDRSTIQRVVVKKTLSSANIADTLSTANAQSVLGGSKSSSESQAATAQRGQTGNQAASNSTPSANDGTSSGKK